MLLWDRLLGHRSIPPYLSHAEFRVVPVTARGLFSQWNAAIRPTKKQHIKSFVETLSVDVTRVEAVNDLARKDF